MSNGQGIMSKKQIVSVWWMGVGVLGMLAGCAEPPALILPTAQATAVVATAPLVPSPSALPTIATSTPRPTSTPSPPPTPQATPTAAPSPTAAPRFIQLTQGDCCTNHDWLDADTIQFIDRDPATDQVGLLGLDVYTADPTPYLIRTQLGVLSPNGRYLAFPNPATGQAIIQDLQTGAEWALNLQQSPVNFTPDSERIVWSAVDTTLPPEERSPTFWLAKVDGSEAWPLVSVVRGAAVGWLGDNVLLIQRTETDEAGQSRAIFGRLNLLDGAIVDWWTSPPARGVLLNPSRTQLVYYSTFNENPEENGMWLVNLQTAVPTPQKLPFLGSYRWRDEQNLLYVPFDPAATSHSIYQFTVTTGENTLLVDGAQRPFLIANNNWSVAPGGRAIVFLASTGSALDGLWLVAME